MNSLACDVFVGLGRAWPTGHPRTIRGRLRRSRTRAVRFAVALAAATVWLWPLATLAAGEGGAQALELERSQAAGWLELQRGQALDRRRLDLTGRGAATGLVPLERQEVLDRRALDQRESRMLDDARRADRYAGPGSPSRIPATQMQIRQAEDAARLGRTLRRSTLGLPPPVGPNPLPPPVVAPFRLR
jgi:hypothetical protein